METNTKMNPFIIVILLVVAGMVGYYLLVTPEKRTVGEKTNDAVNELSHGVDKATRQFKDRTPAEKVGDALKDAGDDIKDSSKTK